MGLKTNRTSHDRGRKFSKIQANKEKYFYLMLLLPLIYILVFKYFAMSGVFLAFKKYVPGRGILGGDWVGFRYFRMLVEDQLFWRAVKNHLVLVAMYLSLSFPIPVIFAVTLNEVQNLAAKRFIQTVSYLPRFISLVIVVSMIKTLLSPNVGIVNEIIKLFGGEPIFFLNEPQYFKMIYIVSGIWQFMGWHAIIYFAAITTIDEQLYEAAQIDGANRWVQTLVVTLPGIMPAVATNFILTAGRLMVVGFEKVLLLYTPTTRSTGEIITSYAYRMGLELNRYSYGTAVDLFSALLGLILILITNYVLKRMTDTSIF
jgi:putative aldouronate transport system permease protein